MFVHVIIHRNVCTPYWNCNILHKNVRLIWKSRQMMMDTHAGMHMHVHTSLTQTIRQPAVRAACRWNTQSRLNRGKNTQTITVCAVWVFQYLWMQHDERSGQRWGSWFSATWPEERSILTTIGANTLFWMEEVALVCQTQRLLTFKDRNILNILTTFTLNSKKIQMFPHSCSRTVGG